MKKNILHYSLLASTSVLAVVVILLGFSQYNNAIGTPGLSETAAVVVGTSANSNTTSRQTVGDPALDTTGSIMMKIFALENTFWSTNPIKVDPKYSSSYRWTFYEVKAPSGKIGNLASTNICNDPISIQYAQLLSQCVKSHGGNMDSIMSSSNRYVNWLPNTVSDGVRGGQVIMHYTGPLEDMAMYQRLGYMFDGVTKFDIANQKPWYAYSIPGWGYCLDSNYVSNYPAYVNNFIGWINSHPYPQPMPLFGQCTANGGGITDCLTGATISTGTGTTGTGTPVPTLYNSQSPTLGSAPTAPTITSTSTTPYVVSVDYNHFTTEAAQYHYTSVYNSTGIKSVNMAVIKLAAGSSLSATQVISQLSALGYRPATLSELASLKTSKSSSVNSSVVALGTNLGGTYGYPTGSGSGASGLGHSAGPFSTTLYSFAAVKN